VNCTDFGFFNVGFPDSEKISSLRRADMYTFSTGITVNLSNTDTDAIKQLERFSDPESGSIVALPDSGDDENQNPYFLLEVSAIKMRKPQFIRETFSVHVVIYPLTYGCSLGGKVVGNRQPTCFMTTRQCSNEQGKCNTNTGRLNID
jgi:hypothetical protein